VFKVPLSSSTEEWQRYKNEAEIRAIELRQLADRYDNKIAELDDVKG